MRTASIGRSVCATEAWPGQRLTPPGDAPAAIYDASVVMLTTGSTGGVLPVPSIPMGTTTIGVIGRPCAYTGARLGGSHRSYQQLLFAACER